MNEINPNNVEKCMECGALFGNMFNEERCVYDNGKFVICKNCEYKIGLPGNKLFCIHCNIMLDRGKIAVSQEAMEGCWYCDVCLQEKKEREKPFGDSFAVLIKAFDKIRKVRNNKGNYKELLLKRKTRMNEMRIVEEKKMGRRYA